MIVVDLLVFSVSAVLFSVIEETARERTTSVQEADTPLWAVAVICTVPGLYVVILPLEDTEATEGSLEDQVTVLILAFLGRTEAFKVALFPSSTLR